MSTDDLRSILDELRADRLTTAEASEHIRRLRTPAGWTAGYDEPCVRDHVGRNPFDGDPATRVVLGVTWCALAVTAHRAATGSPVAVHGFTLDRPVLLAPGGSVTARLTEPSRDGVFEVVADTGSGEFRVADGRFVPAGPPPAPMDLPGLRAGARELPGGALYGGVESRRGPALTTVVRAWTATGRVLAELRLPTGPADPRYAGAADPALLDGAYVAGLAALPARPAAGADPGSAAGVWIPFLIERVRAFEPVGDHCHALVRHVRSLPDTEIVDVTLCTGDGRVLMTLDGFAYRYVRYPAAEPAEEPVQQRAASYLDGKLRALTGGRPVDPHATFMDLGVDSTALIGLSRAIETDLGLELYPTLFFEHQTAGELSAWFAAEHPEAFAPQDPPLPAPAATGRDIAVIGMAGRFADSPDLDAFWAHLRAGTDLVTEVPADRWDWRDWFDTDRDRPGRTYSRWGSFVEADLFDPEFFGIAPREARWLDPQLRLLLEIVHATMEDAGQAHRLRGSRTGVYVGSCFRDYWDEVVRAGRPIGDYEGAAGLVSALAGRLSYTFDLRGPSVPVDTACASSLTALHLAVRALRGGECDTAVVAGVNLILSPLHHVNASRVQALSPTGRCHTFDAAADGYVPGEGAVAVLLKPLDAALRDGDRVHAVIKGSATNHSGRANNPTAPRPEAQTELLLDAWADAGIPADTIGYLEAHGTGTLLGDPIEVRSLIGAFARHTDRAGFCGLGSAKAHLGHLEGAAGLAGVVKVVLSLQHGEQPAMPGFRELNPYLSLDGTPLRIDRAVTAWPRTPGTPRRAGISSFGLTGSNTHVVVEEAPAPAPVSPAAPGPHLLVLSARTGERLRAYAGLLADHLQRYAPPVADVAHTLSAGREPMAERLAVLADDLAEAVRLLRAAEPGEVAHATAADPERVATAQRWLSGGDVPVAPGQLVRLPTYPFARERHWFPITPAGPADSPEVAGRTDGPPQVAGRAEEPPPVAGGDDGSGPATGPAGDPQTRPGAVVRLYTRHWAPAAPAPAGPPPPEVLVVAGDPAAGPAGAARVVVVDPDRTGDLDRLTAAAALLPPGAGVVVLWHPGWPAATGLRLLRALRGSPVRRIVTVQAHRGDADPAADTLGALSGPAALDLMRCTAVEVIGDPGPADCLRAALAEWHAAEAEVRHDRGRRWTPRLIPAEDPPAPVATPAGGTWLITGGLGALGRAVAGHLAARYRAGIVLIGRRSPDPEAERLLDDLRRSGAPHAEYHEVDVTDPAALTLLVHDVTGRLGGLSGVVHAAGVMDPRPWPAKDGAAVDAVLHPKVDGTRALDEATRSMPLAAFVLFSSAAAVLGDIGLGDYGVANRYLDGFAHTREAARRRGERTGRTVSVNWPLWRAGGMHLSGEQMFLASAGLTYLDTAAALAAFDRILAADWPQVLVLSGEPAALDRLTTAAEPVPATVAEDVAPRQRLLADLRVLAAEVLGVDAERMDPAENLGAFGFDSITLRDLAARIGETFGVAVTPTLFYARSSLAEVAAYLVEQGFPITVRDAVPAPVPQPVPVVQPVPAGAVAGPEPIAVVGMSGVFPGAADPDEFWRRLVAGDDLITEVPADRWDWREIYSEERFAPGRSQSKWGGFITGHDRFDADFFGISPREAELMDPQHRIFLQACWAAVEDAGLLPADLSGRRIGVFAGVQFAEYQQLLTAAGISQVQVGTGNAHTMLPNRVSFQLNLRGPSEAVDTACSSSLVAVHRAVQALRAGECEAALAGGVSLILTPYYYLLSNQAGVLSPTGRCRTFDAGADGYVRGEGAGVVMLKTLRRALADGDHVSAVIRGGAVNHGGRASSPTAPNSAAQADLVAAALLDAGVAPATVSYVETHGTGTELGDPVEVEGLAGGFAAAARASGDTLPAGGIGLGSVKTQIGHLEPAAGVAGLIKVVLGLRHRILPGLLHLDTLNPYLSLAGGPFHVVGETRPWLARTGPDGRPQPLRAGLSSFGFGGSNVHLVLEEAAQVPVPATGEPQLLVLSARTPERLRAYADRIAAVLGRGDGYGAGPADTTLADIAYTLQTGREPMAERLALVAGDQASAAALLARFAADGHADGVLTGSTGPAGDPVRSMVDGPAGRDYLRALTRDGNLAQLGRLWTGGVDVDWRALHGTATPRRIPLPTYPFAPVRHWYRAGTPVVPGPAPAADPPATPPADLPDLYVPRWVPAGPAPAAPSAASTRILTTTAGRPLADALAARLPGATIADLAAPDAAVDADEIYVVAPGPGGDGDGAALRLLRVIQALDGAGRGDTAVALRVITAGVYPLDAGTGPAPDGATCHGLARAAAREYPGWRVHVLDLATADPAYAARDARLASAPDLPAGEEVLLRGELRLVRELRPVVLPVAAGSPYRRNGVYLIVGGAGGIGAELAVELARTAGARIALVGRSAPGESHRRLCERIAAAGGEAVYLSADIADPAATARVVAQVRERFGGLHGVVHSALVLRDGTLRSMTGAALREVLAPKVAGLVSLAGALAEQPLDFLLLFSSAQSFVTAAGQGNYAAASAFEDAYAGLLRHRGRWPVRVINWGYWGGVGAVATPEYARRLAAQGARSIEPAEGMELVRRVLAGPADQVLAVRTDRSRLAEVLRVAPLSPAEPAGAPLDPPAPAAPARLLTAPPRLDADTLHRAAAAWDALGALARRWLLDTLRAAGVLTAAGQRTSPDELGRALGVTDGHRRLLAALTAMLERAGWVRRDGGRLLVTPAADTPAPPAADEVRRLATEHPAIGAHLRLLGACLSRYPQVLTGRTPATEVVFPGGAGDLVDGVYAGDEVTAHFNDLVGYAVAEFVRQRAGAADGPVRLVEIGAGTGATSEVLFRRLDGYAGRWRYTFTDVSHQFVQRAAERLGPRRPAADFRALDIERDIAAQGFTPGGADLVLATNVLHATSDVTAALAQAKRLLAPGGWLVLNEGTRAHDYATLTFGLLDGWWRHTDPDLRLPDAPMLSRDAWLAVLAGAGFHDVAVLDLGADCPPGLAGQQSVLVAVSDGLCAAEIPARAAEIPARAAEIPARAAENPAPASVPAVGSSGVDAAVLETIATALRVDPAALDPDGPHADRGVDSVLAIEIANNLNTALGVTIRSTDLFNYPTPAKLAAHIEHDFAPVLSAVTPAAPVAGPVADPGRPPEIAVVGMSGRFPGADDLGELWDNLRAGRCTVGESDRWPAGNPYDLSRPGLTYSRRGGFLGDIDRFDPLFFNISPREAALMDPQHRLFLQESWRALEDAGHAPASLRGQPCGVYVGFNGSDYYRLIEESGVEPDSHAFAGNSEAILAARLPYLLDLKGPSITVNTACSSSLVAVDLACQALRDGTVRTALVGGVMLMTTPFFHHLASTAGMISPAGRCKTFADDADGFVPGEGIGVVVLKTLADALRDGDHVYGVIAGSGVNQDGQTSGIMAPSGPSQTALEVGVYERHGIDPDRITYVEAHGTGTRLGDPIEVDALTDAFRRYTDRTGYCAIGSVKSNIGHTLATAGLAGLLKTLLCLEHRTLVPTVNVDRENRLIDFAGSPFTVNTTCRPWESPDGGPRYAAVSSFGFSGTNAHLVVREAPGVATTAAAHPAYPVPVSGHTPEALRARLSDLRAWLHTHPGAELRDVAFTLATGRAHLAHRAAWVVTDLAQLAALIDAAPAGTGGDPAPAGTGDRAARLAAAVRDFRDGGDPDWAALFDEPGCRRVPLPTYPFAGDRYWVPAPRPRVDGPHPLLGANVSSRRGHRFRSRFTGAEFALADHVVAGRPTLPGVAQLEMARAAGELVAEEPVGRLSGVVWARPLVVTGAGRTVEVVLRPDGEALVFEVTSDDGAVQHARGRIVPASVARPDPVLPVDVAALCEQAPDPLSGAECYRIFDAAGLHYGPSFRGIQRLHRTPEAVLARVALPAGTPAAGFVLHPSVLDAALQSTVGFGPDPTAGTGRLYVPFDLGSVEILGATPECGWAYVRPASGPAGAGGRRLDVDLLDEAGLARVRLRDLMLRALPADPPAAPDPPLVHPADELELMLSRLAEGHVDIHDVRIQLEEMP